MKASVAHLVLYVTDIVYVLVVCFNYFKSLSLWEYQYKAVNGVHEWDRTTNGTALYWHIYIGNTMCYTHLGSLRQ